MSKNIIAKKVIESSEPYLKDRIVTDLVIGLSLAAVQLDNGFVGVSYVHRDDLLPRCGSGYSGDVIGKSAFDIASLLVKSLNPITSLDKTIASAILCAGSHAIDIPDDNSSKMFGVDFSANDTIGMIGNIAPVARSLENKGCKVIVFDKAMSDRGLGENIIAMEKQRELLPNCNKMLISGSAFINGTIDELLELTKDSEETIMVGTSTPMYPAGWQGTGVTVLAGSWWDSGEKEKLFKTISLAGGIPHLQELMIKKALCVKP